MYRTLTVATALLLPRGLRCAESRTTSSCGHRRDRLPAPAHPVRPLWSALKLCDEFNLRPNVGAMTDPINSRHGIDDEPAGVNYPHALGRTDKEITEELDRLFGECRALGEHHLATRAPPYEGNIIVCTHCHRFWK